MDIVFSIMKIVGLGGLSILFFAQALITAIEELPINLKRMTINTVDINYKTNQQGE